jgi:hypothetical protein
MIAHAKACETFPPSGLFIPEILDSNISGLHEGTSFSQPPTPSGMPFELRMDELPKIGCLRISAGEDGSDLLSPGLALNQASTMLFHIDLLRRFNLGAARSQFRSEMEGPLPWKGSLVWPALCQTNSFHGSPPGG